MIGSILLIIVGGIVLGCTAAFGDENSTIGGLFGTLILMLGVIGFTNIIKPTPRAIDVYRGKTKLEITGTYKDSIFIPTDTTVVFKNN